MDPAAVYSICEYCIVLVCTVHTSTMRYSAGERFLFLD